MMFCLFNNRVQLRIKGHVALVGKAILEVGEDLMNALLQAIPGLGEFWVGFLHGKYLKRGAQGFL